MKIYYDIILTESEDKFGDIVSIGLVSETGDTFYAESTDFNIEDCSLFVSGLVVPELYFYGNKKRYTLVDDSNIEMYDNKVSIANKLVEWLSKYEDVEFIGDCVMYTSIALKELLLLAKDKHYGDNLLAVYDINQLVAETNDISVNISANEPIRVETGLVNVGCNALSNAKCIKTVYDSLKNGGDK